MVFGRIGTNVLKLKDTPKMFRENPSAGIGIISSIFVVGYSVSMVITSELIQQTTYN